MKKDCIILIIVKPASDNRSKVASDSYRENYERIFPPKERTEEQRPN